MRRATPARSACVTVTTSDAFLFPPFQLPNKDHKPQSFTPSLPGGFIVLNHHLVCGPQDQDMIDNFQRFDGEPKDIDRMAEDITAKYLSAFSIDLKWVVDAAARRPKWIDLAQSVNLRLATPNHKTLRHTFRHASHTGLKTTYYLRPLGASHIEIPTVAEKM